MPKITVLPHEIRCPDGVTFEAAQGTLLCDALLANHVAMDHACGKCGACSTCHVFIRQGYDSLEPPGEKEEDMLDRAWGLEAVSRLSCQTIIGTGDLIVEIPRYSRNRASENRY